MLAEEFGYQVSPRAAASQTPGVTAAADAAYRSVLRRDWRLALGLFTVLCLPALAVRSWWLLLLPLVGVAGALMAVPLRTRALRVVTLMLSGRPWQVWPVRLGESGVRRTPDRVELLAPDRSTAVAFMCRLPRGVRLGMTDGRGLIWVCGDLRGGVVAALPGADPVWLMEPVRDQQGPPPVPRRDGGLEEELVREAARSVVWDLLG